MSLYDQIDRPTLLLDAATAKRNIARMCDKAGEQNVRLRPHFKTHQSAQIGEWYRAHGVGQITCSSFDMADYFLGNGWDDITVAFPVNIRQMGQINNLAAQSRLGLLVESAETIDFLAANLSNPVDLWIKVDTGNHRTGLSWENTAAFEALARQALGHNVFTLRGLLTHAGQTYQASGAAEVCRIYRESIERLSSIRSALAETGLMLEVSTGDTPGCSLCPDLGKVDEIRPGNYVFYDSQQLRIGSCRAEDIAVAVACPVVAKHAERNEVVIYGGAIHLSKDYLEEDGVRKYGYVCLPGEQRWGAPVPGAYVRGLSQEHGMVKATPSFFNRVKIGDLLCVLPAHSCLTVQVMKQYLTLDGEIIETLN